ncbi:MAG: urease subunit beta [Akkermansiaceae bacterium]|nr:urease subunit beta [Akkermansiaceae bacterium]
MTQSDDPWRIITPSDAPDLELNTGLAMKSMVVANTGDRPVQVGSSLSFYGSEHFIEVR